MRGGYFIGFLYIIDKEKYINHFHRGLKKFIPPNFLPTIRPRVLGDIYNKEEIIIGKAAGVFLKDYNIKGELVDGLILAIEKLKDEYVDTLILDDLLLLNKGDIEKIKNNTQLMVVDGIKVLVFFLPFVLKSIYQGLKEDLKEKEVLIIGDEEEVTKELIEALSQEVRFITLVGDYENSIDNIYEYILEKTGLSIFYSKRIDRILTNYSIIINLKDKYSLNMNRIRKEALIFDFSMEKGLANIKDRPNRLTVIEDFIFSIDQLDIKANPFISPLIPSYLYEYFYPYRYGDLVGLLIHGMVYTIEDFIDHKIINKGKL